MPSVTFQVLEGVDKGRIFSELSTPVTIGREDGNAVRLNDERVSRFHAKVQQDQGDLILTDLESTNGTRVNGHVVQIRRLRPGDWVTVGRSVLLFGSNEEIAARLASYAAGKGGAGQFAAAPAGNSGAGKAWQVPSTMQAAELKAPPSEADLEFTVNVNDRVRVSDDALFIGSRALPPLPRELSPSQAARLAEILDFLHRGLAQICETGRSSAEDSQISLDLAAWQKMLAVEMLLARYLRAITEPEGLENQ